jgi:hypothetical protein
MGDNGYLRGVLRSAGGADRRRSAEGHPRKTTVIVHSSGGGGSVERKGQAHSHPGACPQKVHPAVCGGRETVVPRPPPFSGMP